MDSPNNNILNLYEAKVKRMNDATLWQECVIHLKVLSNGELTKSHRYRAEILFTEAASRSSMSQTKEDFLAALSVLKFIQGKEA